MTLEQATSLRDALADVTREAQAPEFAHADPALARVRGRSPALPARPVVCRGQHPWPRRQADPCHRAATRADRRLRV